MTLDPALLATMRAAVLRTLPTEVEVRRRSRSRTPTGGSDYTWTTAITTRGRVDAMSREDSEIAERLKISVQNAVLMPADVVVTPDDQLRINDVDYDVFAVFANESEPVVKRVLISKAAAS